MVDLILINLHGRKLRPSLGKRYKGFTPWRDGLLCSRPEFIDVLLRVLRVYFALFVYCA
jgi:hypothetical protein